MKGKIKLSEENILTLPRIVKQNKSTYFKPNITSKQKHNCDKERDRAVEINDKAEMCVTAGLKPIVVF